MGNEFWDEYNRLKNKKKKNETEDIAPVRTSNVETSANTDTESSFWSEYEKEKARVEEWRNENISKRSDDGKSIVPVNYKSDETTSQKESKTTTFNGYINSFVKDALSSSDYQKYSSQGASIKNPSYEDASKGISIAGWRPFADEIGNPVTYVRENNVAVRLEGNKLFSNVNYLWANMTDEEVGVYNYYLAKHGKDKAKEYLESIEEELEKREGANLAKNVNGNTVAELFVGAGAGLDNSIQGLTSGVKNLVTGSKDTYNTSAVQIADQIMAQDNTGAMKVAHDVLYGIGNMTPSIAVGILNPAAGAATMGVGVAGNKYNAMIEEGYDVDEARGSAVLTGAAEGLLQYAIGGIGNLGGKAAGSLLAKIAPNAAATIGNTIAQVGSKSPFILRALGRASVEMGKEGLEEGLQTYLEPLIDSWVTGEEYQKPEFEEAVYNALIGALTSFGLEGAPGIAGTTVDTATGKTKLYAREEAVVNRVVEDTIAEAEKNGTKLSNKEKNDIREKVQTDMERGRISTDTIEEVLGGESYKAYTDAVAKEDALRKEYADLGKLQNPTLEQSTRYKELHDQRDTFTKDDTRNTLRGKVRDDVLGLVKGTRLAESYAEQARRGEYFADDLTTYKNEYARKSVANLVNSKAANNTNRTRELAETVAKIAQDKSITFDFTTDEKIKADGKAYISKKNITADGNAAVFDLGAKNLDADFTPVVTVNGKAVDGFKVDYENGTITFASAPEAGEIHIEYRRSGSVNGYYDKQNRVVTVNLNSPKAWQFIVGHEVTHSLEGTESYAELSRAIADYAKTKGDYDGRWDALSSAYNSGTDIDTEITSDLVGEYLFTDEAFVQHLSTNHRNVFQRIYDEIKHLYKMVTAGSKEARELEKVKYAFEKAWRAQAETNAENSGVYDEETDAQYSLVTDKETVDFLENQEHVKVYRAMQVIDGELYPPMAAVIPDGSKQLVEPTKQGEWYRADERPDLMIFSVKQEGKKARLLNKAEMKQNADVLYGNPQADDIITLKDGSTVTFGELTPKYNLDKGNKSTVPAAYNPYFHTSLAALNDQFSTAFKRPNLVVVEGYIPKSELTSGYQALYAKDSVGETEWHSGPVASALKGEKARKVFLSRWFKVGRIVSDAEAASMIAETLEGEGLSVPWNVVTPSLREALAAKGVDIDYKDVKLGSTTVTFDSTQEQARDTNEKLNAVGLQYDANSQTVSYSLSTLEDTFDYNGGEVNFIAAKADYANELAKATGKTVEEANRYLDSLFLVHDMIAADRERLDFEPAEKRSAWVSNAEYGGSVDFSTLCAKRRLFTGTFDAIQNALPDTVLNENDFLRIRNLLLEHGEESPCSMCYVEGSRAKHGVYVERFLKEYLASDPKWKPQIADFTSSTRLEHTRINHPDAYAAYQKAMNSLAQRKPKEASVRTDYKGEILRDFKESSTVKEKNKNGGVRFNSFSDFEIIHALDCMQVITDMARVGLNGQAYTKVKEFAEAFGNTGLKINLSLVAKDVDANGNLVMDETNGMNYAEAMDIRNRYSENVGTVIVVFNDAQLRAALADDSIDYVLPFHRSQWKKSQYAMMGLPAQTKDYTMVQNDRATNPKTGKPAKLSKLKRTTTYINDITGEVFEVKDNIMPNQYWDFSKSGRENAQRYLDYINANEMTPKFDSVLEKVNGKWVLPRGAVGDGYFKLLIDFKMYDNDGWGSPQMPVLPEFNMPYIQAMLDNYVGGHQAFPVANDVVDTFVREKTGVYQSLSSDTAPVMGGNWRTPARDLRYEGAEDIAPSAPAEVATDTNAGRKIVSEADFAPIPEEVANATQDELLDSVRDEDAPPEMDAPHYGEEAEQAKPADPFAEKDIETVGKRSVKAYMYENPEVKPFFQKEANILLGELEHATKGERMHLWGDFDGYGAESYHRVVGVKRNVSPDIEYLLDTCHYTYAQIEKGIKAIIEDNGAENNAVSKRIEFILNDRLRDGYQDWEFGTEIPPDDGYLNLLREKEITEYNEEAFKRLVETADDSVIPPAAEDIAPARETVDDPVNDVAPAADDVEITTTKERITSKLNNTQTELDNNKRLRADAKAKYSEQIESLQKLYDSKKNKNTKAANNILRRIERLKRLSGNVDADYAKRISDLEARTSSLGEQMNQDHTRADNLERAYARIDRNLEADRVALDEEFAHRRASLTARLADRNSYISAEAGKLYDEISSLRKGVRASRELGYLLDLGYDWNSLKTALAHTKRSPGEPISVVSPVEAAVRDTIAEGYDAKAAELSDLDGEYGRAVERLEAEAEAARNEARKADERYTRKVLHQTLVEGMRTGFAERGYDLDTVLKNAKDLSTFATVDNTPQRVMEKSLGYKEGGILADMTVNKVAQNESEAIKWLNKYTDKKNGLLSQLSRQYRIKPGSKASAAAQMYAEGFYVNKHNEIIRYGDNELAADFPDKAMQDRIKGLANDPRIRLLYDQTLDLINDSRTRNAYPEIQKLDNYFLHFRAMDDTFSKLGLPFNPNDIRAKDLPTDLNGVTADLQPGQPYFASAMHREGKRTSFDLLGGLERYLTSAKNQIFHIDDIQTLRALRNYIADSYGQAKGLESLDALTEEEVQDRIKEVYGSHLSTFTKFLNEEANVIAGKTSLTDRGLEGIIGRRGITFLDSVNKQVGANMVGFNVSSSLTNFLPVVQTFAKANKGAFVKAFAQTVSNKLGGITGNTDGFANESSVMIRRKGADRFYRTPWQKMSDPGYFLMGAVDDISTEIIARTKYNELTKKGMDSAQAHYETDKWVSRLMGDRSLGQQPHLYNSKMLGLITKFQLEVRNQLDSQFYDTIQEAKASTEDIENGLERNAKTAAKVASTFFQLAVAQHVFGQVFESIAGYNPAFDIIEAISAAFGLDDDEDSEDTVLDNIEEGFLTLLDDLPYTSTLTGGRIPISSALPITEFIKGKDQYGNEKSRWETLGEAAPYYLMPGGYGQAKKTIKGLQMFDDELPVSGSYTDSGNLRFPVEDTAPNRIQAALFGQWASSNARNYFDNERKPLAPKQIEEYKASEMTIGDYWDYREGLSGLSTIEEKAAYIDSLDIPVWKKTLLVNNLTDRKEAISMEDYEKYGSISESDFANANPARYELMKQNGVTYEQYKTFSDEKKNAYSWASKNPEKYEFIKSIGYTIDDYAVADDEKKEAWTWAYNNPEKYAVSKAVTDDLFEYRRYTGELYNIKADKDADGKSISGSRKDKVIDYINGMDADYGEKIILFKMEYPADDTYNNDIIDYLNSREDFTYEQIETILKELGFKVSDDGYITWD